MNPITLGGDFDPISFSFPLPSHHNKTKVGGYQSGTSARSNRERTKRSSFSERHKKHSTEIDLSPKIQKRSFVKTASDKLLRLCF